MNSAHSTVRQKAFNPWFLSFLLPYFVVYTALYLWHNVVIVAAYPVGIVAILAITGELSRIRECFRGWKWGSGLLLTGTGLATGLVMYGVWKFIIPGTFSLSGTMSGLGFNTGVWIGYIIFLAFVNPLLEEAFWRGFLTDRTQFPQLVDIAFASYHVLVLSLFLKWPFVIGAAIILFLASYIWRIARRNNGGLLVPFACHAAADISMGLAYLIIYIGK